MTTALAGTAVVPMLLAAAAPRDAGLTARTALGLLTGAGIGLGVWLCVLGWRGTPVLDGAVDAAGADRHRPGWWTAARGRRLVAAAAAGLAVLLLTRWIAPAIGIGLLVWFFEPVFGGSRRARLATAQLEALAGWTEALRDLVATGIALPEALAVSVTAAGPAIQPQLATMSERLDARDGLETALRALAEDLDDGGADLIVACLLLNARAQGRALEAVLSALATSTRAELRVRRTIEAERRSARRAVQIVIGVTCATALGLAVGNPTYVAPYRTPAGQLMLAIVAAVFGCGFVWLARLSALPTPPRLLDNDGQRTTGVGARS